MAYRGGIDYLNLPFDQVEWEEHDILSPWSSSPPGTWYSSDSARTVTGLSVIARAFEHSGVKGTDSQLIFDVANDSNEPPLDMRCVILGRMKTLRQHKQERIHYVMVVSPLTSQVARRGLIYKRLGVGYMPGKLIDFDEPGVLARVY